MTLSTLFLHSLFPITVFLLRRSSSSQSCFPFFFSATDMVVFSGIWYKPTWLSLSHISLPPLFFTLHCFITIPLCPQMWLLWLLLTLHLFTIILSCLLIMWWSSHYFFFLFVPLLIHMLTVSCVRYLTLPVLYFVICAHTCHTCFTAMNTGDNFVILILFILFIWKKNNKTIGIQTRKKVRVSWNRIWTEFTYIIYPIYLMSFIFR